MRKSLLHKSRGIFSMSAILHYYQQFLPLYQYVTKYIVVLVFQVNVSKQQLTIKFFMLTEFTLRLTMSWRTPVVNLQLLCLADKFTNRAGIKMNFLNVFLYRNPVIKNRSQCLHLASASVLALAELITVKSAYLVFSASRSSLASSASILCR